MLKNGLAYVTVNIQRSKGVEASAQGKGRIKSTEPAAATAVKE